MDGTEVEFQQPYIIEEKNTKITNKKAFNYKEIINEQKNVFVDYVKFSQLEPIDIEERLKRYDIDWRNSREIKKVISKRERIGEKNHSMYQLYHGAIQDNDVEFVRYLSHFIQIELIEEIFIYMMEQQSNKAVKLSPWTYAAMIEGGADIKRMNESHNILFLSSQINIETFKMIYMLDRKQNDQETLLQIFFESIRNNQNDVIDFVLKLIDDFNGPYKDTNVCQKAIESNANLDLVKKLIDLGANYNYVDPVGRSCLYIACQFCDVEIAEYFMSLGIDPEIKTDSGYTALTISLFHNKPDCVELFLKNGANPNIIPGFDEKGYLKTAIAQNRKELTKLLIKYGADTSVINDLLSDRYNFRKNLASCIDIGIPLDVRLKDGETILIYFIRQKMKKLASF